MKLSLPPLAILFLILLSPSSFAETVRELKDTRTNFEMQKLDMALAEAAKARSEAVLDARISELSVEVANLDKSVTPTMALHEIIELVDGEQWVDSGWHRFGIIGSLLRSQGVVVNEKGEAWYSGQKSILRAKNLLADESDLNLFTFPPELEKKGVNHVGDIDYFNGKIYAGLEDGPKYNNGFIGIYDARTLKFEKAFALPHELQLEGVPWVALDPTKNVMYSAEYYHPTVLNAYEMSTGKTLPGLKLSQEVRSWQGAKVLNGFMYADSDGPAPTKCIYKINLATGTVIKVAAFTDEMAELEGLTFSHDKDGLNISALGIGYGKGKHTALNKRAELHTFKLKKMSLRDQLRQQIGTY